MNFLGEIHALRMHRAVVVVIFFLMGGIAQMCPTLQPVCLYIVNIVCLLLQPVYHRLHPDLVHDDAVVVHGVGTADGEAAGVVTVQLLTPRKQVS